MTTNSPVQRQDGSNGLPPAFNPGQFGNAPPNTDVDGAVSASIVAGSRTTVERLVDNGSLAAGDVIIGADGSRNRVDGVRSSSQNPGFRLVDFASGITGLVDLDGESLVAASDEQSFQFTKDTITEDEFSAVWKLRSEFNRLGVSWSQSDCEYAVESFFEDNDELDDDVDQQEVWERLQSSHEWNHLPQAAHAAATWIVESKVGEILRQMLAEKATADTEMAFERQIERDGR
jgi:hypothetical protein